MVNSSSRSNDIEPPLALRPRRSRSVEDSARHVFGSAASATRDIRADSPTALRGIVLGATAALALGFVLDLGPWSALLGPAGAQEAPTPSRARTADVLAQPSEADKAALRYFAREGNVERLEAELRRLRALYPNWSPSQDLLNPQQADEELQRIYDLAGQQRWEEAREAIAEKREQEPGWSPPDRLASILENAEARIALRDAAEAGNYREVLRIAENNERILTCEDPASLWRVAEAFASTGNSKRAFDAYSYLLESCETSEVRASTLQKASDTLDTDGLTRLFERDSVDPMGDSAVAKAQLDIIRGAVARGGERDGDPVPAQWLETLAEFARTGENLQDSMLVGYYLFRQGNPSEAAQWFRFALDNGMGAAAAEGYIVALRATDNRENDFLAREVAYLWREQTPELMESYLDAMATVLTADERGERSIFDVEQASVDRFVPVVIKQRDANGAQALGWYAFNTCQFIIAEEWFISSANWVPTEAAIYGLALARLRLGDQAGFNDVVEEWGPLYPSVRALATPRQVDPEDPVTGDPDDPTNELGVDSVVCDPEARERLRQRIVEQEQVRRNQVSFTEAGSANLPRIAVAPMARRPEGMRRPDIPRRSVVIEPRPVERENLILKTQAIRPPAPVREDRQRGTNQDGASGSPPSLPAPSGAPSLRTVPTPDRDAGAARNAEEDRRTRPVQRRTTVVTGGNRARDTGGATVRRRVGRSADTSSVDAKVRSIVERPARTSGRTRRSRGTGGGASAAQRGPFGGQLQPLRRHHQQRHQTRKPLSGGCQRARFLSASAGASCGGGTGLPARPCPIPCANQPEHRRRLRGNTRGDRQRSHRRSGHRGDPRAFVPSAAHGGADLDPYAARNRCQSGWTLHGGPLLPRPAVPHCAAPEGSDAPAGLCLPECRQPTGSGPDLPRSQPGGADTGIPSRRGGGD